MKESAGVRLAFQKGGVLLESWDALSLSAPASSIRLPTRRPSTIYNADDTSRSAYICIIHGRADIRATFVTLKMYQVGRREMSTRCSMFSNAYTVQCNEHSNFYTTRSTLQSSSQPHTSSLSSSAQARSGCYAKRLTVLVYRTIACQALYDITPSTYGHHFHRKRWRRSRRVLVMYVASLGTRTITEVHTAMLRAQKVITLLLAWILFTAVHMYQHYNPMAMSSWPETTRASLTLAGGLLCVATTYAIQTR